MKDYTLRQSRLGVFHFTKRRLCPLARSSDSSRYSPSGWWPRSSSSSLRSKKCDTANGSTRPIRILGAGTLHPLCPSMLTKNRSTERPPAESESYGTSDTPTNTPTMQTAILIDPQGRISQDILLGAIRSCAETHRFVTVDDVWQRLGIIPDSRAEASKIGPAMQEAEALGMIAQTNEFVRSLRVRSHGNLIRVWKSLIY